MDSSSYNQLEKSISANRLSTYKLSAIHHSYPDTIVNYLWNTKLSENFYQLLQNLEVALRNAIYDAFTVHFSTQPFFYLYETDIKQPYIKRREYHSFGCWKMIGKVKSNFTNQGVPPSDGKIIAQLNFGFWTTLLNEKHYRIKMWRVILADVFPHYTFTKSRDNDMKQIAKKIDKIRTFRNRIFHYEPIFNQGGLDAIHNDIIDVLGWINPELQKLSLAFDEFDKIIDSKRHIRKKLNRLYPKKYKQ